MKMLKKIIEVKPNSIVYLYKDNKFLKKLDAGIYKFWDFQNRISSFYIPLSTKFLSIINQEVLTKDNIALRFSYNILYKIENGEQLLSKFVLNKPTNAIIAEAEQRIYNYVQIALRKKIVEYTSDQLNEMRNQLDSFSDEKLNSQALELGIKIESAQLKDITFPRSIQELFAKQLEAKIRAKVDLENARTTVATARALKNASEIMKNDENIKFFQYLETITKIAAKGKHTFIIGENIKENKA